MQKPTAPTLAPTVASSPRSADTAPSRSRAARGISRPIMSRPAAVEIGRERDEAVAREAVAHVADVVDEAPPLLDHEDAGPAARRGPREIAPYGLPAARELDVTSGAIGHARSLR